MDELKYERVDGDLYGIAERLKEIDDSYFVLRDRKSGRLELHSSAQRGSSYALTFARKTLDERDIRQVLATRRERAKELLAETERENAALERELIRSACKRAELETERLLKTKWVKNKEE